MTERTMLETIGGVFVYALVVVAVALILVLGGDLVVRLWSVL